MRVNVYGPYIFFLTVKLMFFSWNWENVYSKMIVKSIFIGAGKLLIHRKIVIERKQLCKEWSHAIARTARGDDNNNNTHLFSLLSVNKFKRFLLNFLIKHMVNASSCTAELWMHSRNSRLLSSQQLEELRIVYWRHQRAQWEYEARSCGEGKKAEWVCGMACGMACGNT